jgi:hypothetical protein
MPVVAVIIRTPRVELTEWIAAASSDAALVRPPVYEKYNPYKHTTVLVDPAEGEFHIVLDGTTVGAVEPSSDFDINGELHVYAPKEPNDQFKAIVSRLTTVLRADVEWGDL